MYQTIQVSSCVFVQGEFVAALADGRVVIRDGSTEYRGQPIAPKRAQRAIAVSGMPFARTTRAN